ncbi:MAG: M1 family metallopeptidase [Phycisphaerales bacterium]|nr:M1 family metallopeptidase [Phycisphaerales bacterium]
MRPTPIRSAFALVALALLPAAAIAQNDGQDDSGQPRSLRWDPQTGKDLANYLPHRDFDHTHMTLELDFPDFEHEARATCRCTLTMEPIGSARQSVRLDAVGMEITKVAYEGREIGFTHEGGDLRIDLPESIPLGRSITLAIEYTLGPDNMAADGEALTWSPPKKRPSGPSEEVPMLHSQGEPEYARRWFPCFDHPNERLSTELIVTVADGYEVVSNGELKSKKALDDGRVRWHWDQAMPHAPYLVSLVIGKFDVVDVGGPDSARPGLPMPVYGPVGTADSIRKSFAHTPAMVAYMEKLFDEPYPWAKYSQAIVRDFAAGAMENTSATTFFPFAAAASPGSIDDIIVHELTHQWTGDLLTNKNWAHLWLQEGWATYGEALWSEHVGEQDALDAGKTPDEAKDAARKAYLRAIRGNFRQAARRDSRTSSPESPALASNLYRDPNDTFTKANNPYPRGACVLHMLRERLGDQAFWAGVRLYIDRYKFAAVETDDFRKCLEEASGDSLERFFAQWVYRAGAPRADVEIAWEPGSEGEDGPGTATITFRQVQTIDADNPAYAMVVPVYLKFESAPGEYVYIDTEEREVVKSFELSERPIDAVVDPYNWNILDANVIRKFEPQPAPAADEHAAEAAPVGEPAGH